MTPFAVLSAVGAVQQLRATVNGWSRRITMAAIYGIVALVLAAIAVAFLAAALFFALAEVMSPIAAAAIVAAVLLVLAAIAALLAQHAIQRGRGGTGAKLPVALPGTERSEMMRAVGNLGSIDPNTLYALAAGLVGGLVAAQLRSRNARAEDKRAD
jgi:hypothetical protein